MGAESCLCHVRECVFGLITVNYFSNYWEIDKLNNAYPGQYSGPQVEESLCKIWMPWPSH